MLKKLILLAVFAAGPWSAVAAACSAAQPEPFDVFFKRFAGDRAYALERTVLPLQMWRWEYGLDANGKDDSSPGNPCWRDKIIWPGRH
ncbi:MAG: hypothetical protein ACK4F4_05995 [Hylemonella sp.]|uniref:hypothetical protein n=1 Tax=Hylemonella sp. TaxID=2066020 RepID=UPI003918D5F5